VVAPRQYAMQISNATIPITVNGYSVEPITLDFSADGDDLRKFWQVVLRQAYW